MATKPGKNVRFFFNSASKALKYGELIIFLAVMRTAADIKYTI